MPFGIFNYAHTDVLVVNDDCIDVVVSKGNLS